MKTNNETGLAKDLKEKSFVWLGKCAEEGKYLLMEYPTENTILFTGITVDKTKIVLEGTKESMAFKTDFSVILNKIVPKWKNLAFGSTTFKSLPDEYKTIVGDFNKDMSDNKLKYLNESFVIDALTKNGFDISGYTYYKKVVDTSFTLKFKPLVTGKDNWTKEQLEHAEDIDFAAKYTPSYPNLMKYFLNGSLRHFFFDGAPGAGKSYESKIWCAASELPYIHVSCNASMGLDVLFGSERPRTDGKEGFTFVYGPLYYAIKFGMVVGMDEFTTLPVESQNLLLSICEGHTKQFTLQNGEIVPINPNFRIIATANIGMAGNNEISEALVDRFTCRAFDDLTKDQLIERMSSCELYDCNNKDLIEVVADKLLLLKEYFRNNNFKTALSVRNAQNFIAALLSDQEAKDKSLNFNLFTSCFIDATKINGDTIEMSELQELRDMATPYYDEIMGTLNVSEGEEEAPTPVKLTAKFDLEDLDEQTDSFMSEEGIEIPEEEA